MSGHTLNDGERTAGLSAASGQAMGAGATSQERIALSVAVLIPCYNEAITIGDTVTAFRAALPQARIYVYDNNSSDQTCDIALAAGAIVRKETRQGKGSVVRRMFADVDADIYVLVDGDNTYDAEAAESMIDMLVTDNLDMVVGCRQDHEQGAYRPGHRLGNAVLTGFLAWMFGRAFSDTLSGYRIFSRRFVKSFPSLSSGFEIETEINVHALELKMPTGEKITRYDERPVGSDSKLNTYRDGVRILAVMISLFRREKPSLFFGLISLMFLLISIGLFYPLAVTYMHTGAVPRLPTAILCTGIVILAMLSAVCGLILDTVTHGRREMRRLAYLNFKAPNASR